MAVAILTITLLRPVQSTYLKTILTDTCNYIMVARSGALAMQKLRSPLLRTQSDICSPFKTWSRSEYSLSIPAFRTAKKFFLVLNSTFPVQSEYCFPNPLPRFKFVIANAILRVGPRN